MASIRFENVCKSYDNKTNVVRNLDLQIGDGRLMTIVGPSGCGKSTTLRMLAGLDEPTSGEIYIGGHPVNGVAPSARDVAMVFQDFALYPHLSVRRNLGFGLELRRVPQSEIASRVQEASQALGLELLLDRRPHQLSGGQRQRVALGRAIVRNPRVFLFDEPLSNLDAQLRVQMRTEIAALHQRLGTTTVYVTHDQVEAMTLGERIAVMRAGVVQQVDSPLVVYDAPANRFVAGFIGSPSMNFIAGRVRAGQFEHTDGRVAIASRLGDGPAVLGIRPEHLHVGGAGPSLGRVRIEIVEHLGHESLVHFILSGKRYAARLESASRHRAGDEVDLRVSPEDWHLFADDDVGKRLE